MVFGLPWLVPVLIRIGATGAGRAIYFAYGLLCHQFADRSFFLFGERASYAASELLSLAPACDPRLALRVFRGTPDLGYKVAWSDRMVAIYGGLQVGGLLFARVRRRLDAPRWWGPALLLVPMAVDGAFHVLSDLAGLNVGFRYTNLWLAALTRHRLDSAFYVGNALGSFNSWARLISGALAGLAAVWGAYSAIERTFGETRPPWSICSIRDPREAADVNYEEASRATLSALARVVPLAAGGDAQRLWSGRSGQDRAIECRS